MSWSLLFGKRYIIPNIGFVLSVIAAVVAWRRSTASRAARTFAWWLVLGAVTNFLNGFFGRQGVQNTEFAHWYRLFSASLVGLTGYLILPEKRDRIILASVTVGFIVFWITMTLTGLEGPKSMSRFLDPAETGVGLITGVMLVAAAIRHSDASPFARPEGWLGIGLVLSCAPSLLVFPITTELYRRNPGLAVPPLTKIANLINDVSLLLWCIPYWKRSIVWTR